MDVNVDTIIAFRISKIKSGSLFGEYSVYDDAIFPYGLLEVVSEETGEIIVMDMSKKNQPVFAVNVTDVYIMGVDDD